MCNIHGFLCKLLVNNGLPNPKREPSFIPLHKPLPAAVAPPVQEVHVEIAPAPHESPRKVPTHSRHEKYIKQKEGKEIKDRKNKADKKGRERRHREESKVKSNRSSTNSEDLIDYNAVINVCMTFIKRMSR